MDDANKDGLPVSILGSRYQGMVDAPAPTDWDGLSLLLTVMLIYETLSDAAVSRMALSCAIVPVLGLGSGVWSKVNIGKWYQSACVIERHLKEAKGQLKNVMNGVRSKLAQNVSVLSTTFFGRAILFLGKGRSLRRKR
ncbi:MULTISPECIES: hypothetical protein [Burkholderiaceae]|uniref:hypothetical protein n=1 Tax=Burkholderiaceae TaxID=119060 RepID=UPI001115A571|nr:MULTISPECIES: hypothetical protein [Burkholderiaceae]MCG1039399.1 hypothetical protein [Mycetohabitans sp. B7]